MAASVNEAHRQYLDYYEPKTSSLSGPGILYRLLCKLIILKGGQYIDAHNRKNDFVTTSKKNTLE